MSSEEQQRVLAELAYLQSYAESLESAIASLSAALDSITVAKEAIKAIREHKCDELLIPIGADSYVYGALRLKDKVVVHIGAGYYAELTLDEADKLYDERQKEVLNEINKLRAQLAAVMKRIAELSEKIRSEKR